MVIVGLAKDGPAQRADLRTGDVLLSVAGSSVHNLAGLYRRVWSLGAAGVEVPFSIYRDGKTIETRIKTGDRNRFLKAPQPALRPRSRPAPLAVCRRCRRTGVRSHRFC